LGKPGATGGAPVASPLWHPAALSG